MWREELGLVEMLFTYIGDFVKFESYADWRPVLIDILTSHEEVRRRRIAEAIEYSSGERMKDDIDEDFVEETRQPYNETGYASLLTGTEERNNTYSQSLMEYSHDVTREENTYFIESDRIPPRIAECVNVNIKVENNLMVGEESVAQQSESQISEESIVCSEMENGDASEFINKGAPEIVNVNVISEGSGQEIRNGQRPGNFNCSVCAKSYVSKRKLSLHMIYHNKVGVYKCSGCEKSFCQSGDLKRHLRIHSGECPFQCYVCGKAFSVKATLKRHIQTVHFNHRPFSCQLCERAFYQMSELKAHMRFSHDSEVAVSSLSCG